MRRESALSKLAYGFRQKRHLAANVLANVAPPLIRHASHDTFSPLARGEGACLSLRPA